ncbi:MAG: accessory factor UbiK family protein [Burkholderiales bacterium]
MHLLGAIAIVGALDGVNGGAAPARYNAAMSNYTPNPTFDKLTSLAQRVGEAIAASPAGELEKNARQHFVSQLAKQGLVTREEFDAQRALLENTRAKLRALEDRIAALEHKSA